MHAFRLWEEVGVPGENPHRPMTSRQQQNAGRESERATVASGLRRKSRVVQMSTDPQNNTLIHKAAEDEPREGFGPVRTQVMGGR